MAFAVICKSCQARFLLNDDLLRRKVAGRVVTVRCRQCHATIEVDGSDVDPSLLPETEKPARPAPTRVQPRGTRPAPSPPRPTAKSTLMGIGVSRPAGATELVALSPGSLDVNPAPVAASPRGFPEPPPPPGAVELLGPGDWDDLDESPPAAKDDAAPESLDDFAEELPPSNPPEEGPPSSTGTPSLKALTHHDEQGNGPPIDDFLANMSAAMNGGMMIGAPTIDVSELTATPPAGTPTPKLDVSETQTPVRGAETLPLFASGEGEPETPSPSPAVKAAPTPAQAPLSPAPDRLTPQASERADSPRERKNVVAPTSKSVPPAAAARKASGLAVPLLLAVAAAAGFLIWKRSAAQPPPPPIVEEVRLNDRPELPPAPVAAAPAEPALPAGATSALAKDDTAFEMVPTKPQVAALDKPAPLAAAPAAPKSGADTETKTEPTSPAVAKEEPTPEPEPADEPTPPAEPAGPFDRAAAGAALTASAGQASSCRKEGDPSGVASVIVTFAPSGRVTSANISGPPFAGTPTGGCIASTLRKTRIAAFEGERVTVSKTVVIQ